MLILVKSSLVTLSINKWRVSWIEHPFWLELIHFQHLICPFSDKICYFQLITPASNQETDTCTPLKIKQIMYIRPNLKVFEALFKLKNSPLVNHILNPKYNCFQPNNQPFEYNGFVSLLATPLEDKV